MSHSYNTRYQAKKALKKAAEPQEEKEEKGEIHYLKPAVWHVVDVPTRGLYRFQDQELFRVIIGTFQLISKMSRERHSQESLIELFEYLHEKPYVLMVRPKLGQFIRGEIGIIKPIIAEHAARLAEMTKMLGASTNGVYQEKVDKWLHLKDIMALLEKALKIPEK